ncbi:uncharacterized protein [Panulirus ornatus]|uniref:uncharacterized protein n=1 Tax=Panulirus ornatus TaxID=150431 RepID=UPI003A891DC4
MNTQVLSAAVMVALLAASATGKPDAHKGGKGGGGYGDDHGHGGGYVAYQTELRYKPVETTKPVVVHKPVVEHHPYYVKKPIVIHPAPQPILVHKPVVHHVQEWKLVTVPKTTYQPVWVHKIPVNSGKGKGKGKGFGFFGGGKGKGGGGGDEY